MSPGGPGLTILAGANVTDTVQTRLSRALSVQLRDASGQPAAGVVVRFEGVPAGLAGGFEAYAMRLDGRTPDALVVDTTDASGHADVLVSLGRLAGPARLVITAPTLGYSDTARYTVLPGAAVRVRWSVGDTAVTVGGHAVVKAFVADRNGNARTETPTYSANQYIASVDAAGNLTAGSVIGRGVVRATFGAFRDSVAVTVVPSARIVVLRPGEVGLVNVDGSGYARVVADPFADHPAVNHAGTQVAYHAYTSTGYQQIFVVDVGTGARRMLLDPSVIISAVHPRYSADGAFIYFAARRTLNVEPSIWRVRPDGTGLEEVVTPGTASYSFPDPSPDGREVAFSNLFTGRVVVKTLATGAMRTMSMSGTYPRYSPDGASLAALSAGITVIGVDGTGARSFSYSLTDGGLSWCPNGACLLARGYSSLVLAVISSGEVMDVGANRDKVQVSF